MVRFFVRIITRLLLSLRYRCEVKGLDTLTTHRGICFLPNHPSLSDPVILMAFLAKEFKPRPVVVETMYEIKPLTILMKFLKAIAIPDFDLGGNDYTRLLARKSLQKIVKALEQGDNILLYPSGRLKKKGYEEVRGTSGAFDIVKNSPHAKIVLVRTEGLWGSLFSLARVESSAQILACLGKAALLLVKNLLFFAPRRTVTITFYEAPSLFYTYQTKEAFNKALEEWYNQPFGPAGEPLNLVREHFWSFQKPSLLPRKTATPREDIPLPEPLVKKVIAEISFISKKAKEEISLSDNLASDVGLDSLDIITLIAFLEEEFSLRHLTPQQLETVFDAVYLAAQKREIRKEKRASVTGWSDLEERLIPGFPEGETLVEVFLKNCEKRGSEAASADLLSGKIISYKKAKQIVVILSERFKKLPSTRIGVMMPATSMSYFVVLALMMAGKIPVMLNWTLGRYILGEAIKSAGIEQIISSEKFVRFAKMMDLEGIDDKLLFLEELGVTWFTKLQGAIKAQGSTRTLLKGLGSLTGESIAVILFTSGSESTPKAVPLTHKNILSNQRDAFSIVSFQKDDVLLGFLPPFHSFGFSVTGLLPFMSGLLVLFAPDPTDSYRLAESLTTWHITFLCGAPTFLRALLQSIEGEGGESVRLIVTGAEKAPPLLFSEAQKKCPHAHVIEGYGITECSPILTMNIPGEAGRGVGRPLPHVTLAICDLAKTKLLPQGEEGIILVRGPGIFKGYLVGKSSPFIHLGGQEWYVTGDLGYIDETGALWLSGRLKRFVKMGGEMINLVFIEELLNEGLGAADSPYLAVIALEKDHARPELVLFTTRNMGLDEANLLLRRKKLSSLIKISRIIPLEEMPLLGTGKVNVRALEAKIKEKIRVN